MTLALFGGSPTRSQPFPRHATYGEEERLAAERVLTSGILSRFLGSWHPDFYGGPEVQAFEEEWATAYEARFAVSVNSATSGLQAAVGACGLEPGDEIIVSPYSMCASATAPLIYGAVPRFADIERERFTLCPASVEAAITSRTKAILVVHLFGCPADMDALMDIADRHNLMVIEDCAQAPFARLNGKPVGTLGHLGVFSLNYHKHVHTGEGGVVVTNDPVLAERLQLIRNHAEAVVEGKGVSDLSNMVGFNFRLGEIEAALGRVQLAKAERLVSERRDNVTRLESMLTGLPGLKPAPCPAETEHSYYLHALLFDAALAGVPREAVVAALRAELPVTELREGEGPLIRAGYIKPLYYMPLFQRQIAIGGAGFPFTTIPEAERPSYAPGTCPITEDIQDNSMIIHEWMRPGMTEQDLSDVADAFHKVFDNLNFLRSRWNEVGKA
ncbi:DegT/DnrJ/EryC1/StrS family aminotransferase [Thalassospiraceae bacterium LMO-JJ14]|nr:DegT/DnrJ/EryC1/StrS family aminotransferase [Thalassospiraceae bacterium LMO-JJ14]